MDIATVHINYKSTTSHTDVAVQVSPGSIPNAHKSQDLRYQRHSLKNREIDCSLGGDGSEVRGLADQYWHIFISILVDREGLVEPKIIL